MNINKLRGEIAVNYKTQSAFARAINWHQNKLSFLMNNKYTPDIEEVKVISNALNLSDEQFLEIFLDRNSRND